MAEKPIKWAFVRNSGKCQKFLAVEQMFLAIWDAFLADYICKSFWRTYKMGICEEFRKVPKIMFLAV